MKKQFREALPLLFLVSFITLTFFSTYGQGSFKLSDYKNPDYTYRLLDFNFGLNGNNFVLNENLNSTSDNKTSQSALNANLNPRYTAKKNTKAYQGFQQASIGVEPSWWRSERKYESPSNEILRKSGSLLFGFDVYSSNRFYNPRLQFIEVRLQFKSDNQLSGMSDDLNPKNYPFNYKSTSNSYKFDIAIPLMVGKGRIEEVQDARLAVYILEDLEKSGDLAKKPDANEILEVAKFITKIKNQRHFDHRLRLISEITAVDSLLDAIGLKGKSGASYFTLLNDNWSYSNGPIREAGKRFSIGLVPSIRHYSFNNQHYYNDSVANQSQLLNYKNEYDQTQNHTGIQLLADYRIEKPVNLYWQNSSTVSAGYRLISENLTYRIIDNEVLVQDIDRKNLNGSLHLYASNTIGYYPNSRTSLLLNAYASFIHRYYKIPEDNNSSYSYLPSDFNAGIGFSVNYYVSPQLRFSANLGSNASILTEKSKAEGAVVERDLQKNYIATNLSAGFIYSIF
ncbi:MAG: hypothetical protein Q8J88_18620 [Bacteroidales bacterium]|nr:hypothetical protein [Bacteroidales bacterium]